ncbi:hypothetical protein MMC28_010516, partial [Mycoblastus sanguinarius]|nr:hypothetical protein [Mycoblastus sanguinarius]
MSANENTAENTTQDQPNLHSNISADQHVSRFTPTQRTTLHAAINAAVNKAFDAAVQRAMGPLVQQKTTMLMQLKDIIPQQLEKATFVPSKPPAEYSVPQPPTTPLVPPPSGPLLAHQRPVLYQNEGPIGQFRQDLRLRYLAVNTPHTCPMHTQIKADLGTRRNKSWEYCSEMAKGMFGFTTIQTMGAMNRSMDVSFGDALTVMEYDL